VCEDVAFLQAKTDSEAVTERWMLYDVGDDGYELLKRDQGLNDAQLSKFKQDCRLMNVKLHHYYTQL